MMGPDLLVHTGIYLMLVFKEASLHEENIWKEKTKPTLNIRGISAFSVFKHEVEGCNSASWSTAGPFESYFDFSFTQQLTQPCHRKKKLNMLLMFSYLWVTEFLRFFKVCVWKRY